MLVGSGGTECPRAGGRIALFRIQALGLESPVATCQADAVCMH